MVNNVAVGLSTEREPAQAAKEAVQQAKTNIGSAKIDLAIVFASVDLSSADLLETIALYLGETPVVGCSSAAIISNQGIFKHGVVIMLLSFSKDVYFNTACVENIKTKTLLSAGEELGEKLLYGLHNIRRDLSVIFSDGLMGEAAAFISGLQERLGRSFPLVGASSSDNLLFKKTYLYCNQQVFSEGACGILWGGKLNFGLGIKHGWKPLGKTHRVTKSSGNIVSEIDGLSAVKIYEDYLACDLVKLTKESKRISVLYPIGIYLAGENEYLLRNIISINSDGSIVFQGNVPEDSQIRLMATTRDSCLSSVYEALDEVKKGLLGKIDFVFVFDSVSRYILLGRDADKELKIIKEGLDKDTPIIGLYTYGEQAPLKAIDYKGQAYFHNQTITILAIGEQR